MVAKITSGNSMIFSKSTGLTVLMKSSYYVPWDLYQGSSDRYAGWRL